MSWLMLSVVIKFRLVQPLAAQVSFTGIGAPNE
jgi:hypothetical protein